MDDLLKLIVMKRIENELGKTVKFKKIQWEKARDKALNDIYLDMFCAIKDVSFDYFTGTIIEILLTENSI
ncbi:MAG: hypothetical protein WC677_07005 [Clostridia bacterium]|jgi:hypothetical protein